MSVQCSLSQSFPYCLALGILLLPADTRGSLKAQESGSLAQRFLDEAPRQWEKYNSHVFQLQGHIRLVIKKQGKETSRRHWEIKEKPGGYRLTQKEAEDLDSHAREQTVYASNPNYAFSLRRKAADLPWVLIDVRMKRPGGEFELPDNYKDEIGSGVQSVLTTVRGSKLLNLVRQPNFRVLRTATVNRDSLALVQIDFENPHALDAGVFEPIQSGTLLLDPQRSWCVRGYEVHAKHSNSVSVSRSETIQIRDSSEPHYPLPVQIVYSTTSRATEPRFAGQTVTISSVLTYDLDVPRSLSDDDFRLSAFGLPEPREPSRSRWYLWAAAAAVACLSGAAVCRWLMRRASPRGAP